MNVIEQDEPPSTALPARTSRVPALLRHDPDVPLTPTLVPILFLGISVLAILAGLVAVVAAFVAGLWLGLLALAAVPMLVLGVIALARIGGELALAVIQVTEDVAGIAARLPRLESTVYDVANEIPRFGFLRLLSGGRDRY
ncbi:MAG TPA: hypothetical protein VNP03_17940 [Pseudonocardia sp.]|nr:hypothetical protein [Pseudonocardia sp.]